MPDVTLRDLPPELHRWLKRQAQDHRRSMNKEVIALLESARNGPPAAPRYQPDAAVLLEIGRRCAALPDVDGRSADEILGNDEGIARRD